MVGRVQSNEEKEKRSNSMTGKRWKVKDSSKMGKHWIDRSFTEEHKKKISVSGKGNKHTEDSKLKISKTRKEKGLGFSSLARSNAAASLKKINSIKKTCPYCNKSGSGPVMSRFHFDACINKVASV
jgi:hypothetical protein